jgi:hypothetical protein
VKIKQKRKWKIHDKATIRKTTITKPTKIIIITIITIAIYEGMKNFDTNNRGSRMCIIFFFLYQND